MGLSVVSCSLSPPDEGREGETAQLPASNQSVTSNSVIQTAENMGDHEIFLKSLTDANLLNRLKTSGPFTIFAPTNLAFEGLPYNMMQNLLDTDMPAMQELLLYHIVPGEYSAQSILEGIKMGGNRLELQTLSGDILTLVKEGEEILIHDGSGISASLKIRDQLASNGVVHSIDQVVMR